MASLIFSPGRLTMCLHGTLQSADPKKMMETLAWRYAPRCAPSVPKRILSLQTAASIILHVNSVGLQYMICSKRVECGLFSPSLQAQLAHERSRDFDAPLEKLTRKTNGRRRELEEQQRKMEELVESEKVRRREQREKEIKN